MCRSGQRRGPDSLNRVPTAHVCGSEERLGHLSNLPPLVPLWSDIMKDATMLRDPLVCLCDGDVREVCLHHQGHVIPGVDPWEIGPGAVRCPPCRRAHDRDRQSPSFLGNLPSPIRALAMLVSGPHPPSTWDGGSVPWPSRVQGSESTGISGFVFTICREILLLRASTVLGTCAALVCAVPPWVCSRTMCTYIKKQSESVIT